MATGNAYTIDKLPDAKRKEVIKAILEGRPDTAIAKQYDIHKSCVLRFRNHKLFKAVAEVWAKNQKDTSEYLLEQFEDIALRLRKVLSGIDKELSDGNGEYDLHNAERAYPYVKMLNDTAKTLQSNMAEIAKIQGLVKETAEMQNSPVLIVNQMIQLVESCTDKDALIAGLKRIADN